MTHHAVAHLSDLDDQRPLRVQAGSEELILLRQGDQVHAFQGTCPHAGAPLDEGRVCDGMLICPWHKAAFALGDGAVCEPPALTGLQRYKAWVQDARVWVDDRPLPKPQPARRSDARCFVVVGAGAAGTAAVATLLDQGFAGRLVWIDQERHPAYDRTALSKFVLAGKMPPDEVPALLEPDDLRKGQLERKHAKVRSLNSQKRQLLLADGQRIDYDACLVATGAKPRRVDVPGSTLAGVYTLRTRDDAEQLLDAATPGEPVVIVGDGFIGLEAASALCEYGAQVHVVSRHDVPLAKQLGERIGKSIRALHQSKGVTFHGPADVVAIEGDEQAQAVLLSTGERLATALVLLGTGVEPVTGFIQGVALADDKSLQANVEMRVADGLWAAGDIATFPLSGHPVRIEHWRLAQQHGVIAAANMLGEKRHYADVPYFWTFHHGQRYERLGHAQTWDQMEYVGAPESGDFIALQCTAGQVQAVIAKGYADAMMVLSQRMRRPLDLAEALELIVVPVS
ncbi:FAD-dependent oxidoreductase [Pseudomonas sp. NBRC 111119]|uniref:FAD-dependent oxidoreductase n=1 Tax=Pseudomonas sp. NBRC 111119 TaxID=1661034 RepID=UPI000761B0B4|nr:FAD-dependent oxidoreductase [Pseudomonas sp. NBRC 111119]